jgi:hypothetical protein
MFWGRLKKMNLEVVSGCRGVSGDLFWEGLVVCELRVLRYHYKIPRKKMHNVRILEIFLPNIWCKCWRLSAQTTASFSKKSCFLPD